MSTGAEALCRHQRDSARVTDSVLTMFNWGWAGLKLGLLLVLSVQMDSVRVAVSI